MASDRPLPGLEEVHVVLYAFLLTIAHLYVSDGPKLPVCFIILWSLGPLCGPCCGVYQAILTIILLLTVKIRAVNPQGFW